MSGDEEDLDDFFNEIEETVAEVKEEEENGDKQPPPTTTTDQTDSDNANKKGEDDKDDDQQPPPSKKQKTSSAPPPVRPRGVVVAAASSVAKPKSDPTAVAPTTTSSNNTATQASQSQRQQPMSSHNTNYPGMPSGPQAYHPSAGMPVPGLPPLPPGPLQPPLPPGPAPTPVIQQPSTNNNNPQPKKPVKRMAAGKVWVDPTLEEWPENDFRIFVGNISGDVTDQQLYDHYTRYASIAKAKIVRDHKQQSKGYGFVSFLQPLDCAKAIRETDQSWLGSRPIRVKRSDWKDRSFGTVMKNQKKDKKQKKRYGGGF